jgi:glycosyltransferase involved in cell wall biosynthesis
VTMLLENDLYPQDVRVRDEADSLRDAGWRVHVIAPRGEGQPARETVDGVSVERFHLRMDHGGGIRALLLEYAVAHVQLYARGARALARGADALHLHNPPDTLFGPAALARLLGRRVVFDQHDLFADLVTERLGRRWAAALARGAQRATARCADLVLVTNESQGELLAASSAIARERIAVVRNGPPAAMLERPAPLRQGSLEDPHLVYVGALEEQDGVDALPGLLAGLRDRHGLAGARLTIVGWGAQLEPLREAAAALGLGEAVRFTGRVSHAEVIETLFSADLCLDTAPCSEFNQRTTMVKIGEYLAAGRPTVAFALRETARTAGDAAELVPCDDEPGFEAAVAALCADGGRRAELGARARERARELTWDRSAAILLDAYARWVRPPPRPPRSAAPSPPGPPRPG